MSNPLVSIPVVVYNSESFLKKQLDSLINQTYKNIEIIVCDDCSTDNSLAIIKEYELFPNFTCHRNEKNLGVIKNGEKALSLCNGEYIAGCDHDDIWVENKIEILVNNIGNHTLIYSNSEMIDENDNLLKENWNLKKISGKCYKLLILQNFVPGHTLMFKKDILKDILPLPQIYLHPDWWFAFVASSIGEIKHLDQTLLYYRQHSTQITRTKKIKFIEPISKFIYKINQYKKQIDSRVDSLKALASCKINDEATTILLNQLIEQTQKLYNSYINVELENILLDKKNGLLQDLPDALQIKEAKELSKGLWYVRIKRIKPVLIAYSALLAFTFILYHFIR
jgi:glycosyltransferase involved in cell wall biosynthesis